MGVTITGLSGLTAKLSNITQKMNDNVENALVESALIVERQAKELCPVDTGRLRSSITYEEVDFGSDEPAVKVGTNTEYAPIVELGSSKQSAQPYLDPAFEENKSKIIKLIGEAIQNGAE